jgi:hypothetical protein
MYDQVRMGGRKKEVDAHSAADAPLTSALAPGAYLESPKRTVSSSRRLPKCCIAAIEEEKNTIQMLRSGLIHEHSIRT